ncbi:hypothetical protein, partial [Halodesulfurarchaeum sp.]|uniref:hypothetical protein n=1 Tax=Halodesulfurarchaeum sp. TaxID=1980530 RepID=UPI002FC33FE2
MNYNKSGIARKVFILMVVVMLVFPGQVIAAESSGDLREAASISDSLSTESEGHLNISLRSDDSLIESPKHDEKSFQLAHSNYRYINHTDGIDKQENGYQSGDVIVKLVEIIEPSDSFNDSNHYTFQQNHVFVKDLSENNQLSNYEYGDDIYDVGLVNESASIERTSGNYRTVKESLRYINSTDSEVYSGKLPIIQSSDSILDGDDQIKKEGSGDVTVNLSTSDYQIWEDPDYGTDYTKNEEGGYGEPIYNSGGDGNVNAGVDKRITKAQVFTGDDQNQSTIDFDLNENTLVSVGDPDLGSNLNDLPTNTTMNMIDPDGDENSAVDAFGEEDIFFIDVQGDSTFDSNRDIALNKDVENGRIYDKTGINGTWKNGRTKFMNGLVIFDKNNNNEGDDLLIRDGKISVGEADMYSDNKGKIRFFNTNSETTEYRKAEDGLFVDIKKNGVSGNPSFDLRISNYNITYPENTTVKDQDLDAELDVRDFESNEFFVDMNMNDELEGGESLLKSKDESLGPEDDVIVDGGANSLSSMSMESDSFILLKTAGNFQKDVPIVRVESNYPGVSKQYTTNNLSYAEDMFLHGFSNGTEYITVYNSNSSTFTDNSGISIIEKVNLSEPSNIAKDTKVPIELFSKALGHISQNSTIQSTSGIYREKDTQSVGSDTFGDRL